MTLEIIREQLQAFVSEEFGSSAELLRFEEADGHAGLTYFFDIAEKRELPISRFVLKLPPAGVRWKGNTDVYRQAPLLRALHKAGLPVPDVPFAFTDNPWFDRPFIVMERLAGRVFFVWEPHPSFPQSLESCGSIWQQCIELLTKIHQFDWRQHLSDWDTLEPLAENVNRWQRIYEKAPESAWVEIASRVHRRLLETLPNGEPVGLFHGDYQPGNILYEDEALTGAIDWELAGIGPTLLDVGWLMIIGDQANWYDGWRTRCTPDADAMRASYEDAMGCRFESLPWYQAFAGYRLASIACLNVKLHRKGQRRDSLWEKMAPCVMLMFTRAEAILARL